MLKRLLLIATISLTMTSLNLLASDEHYNLDELNNQVQDTISKIQNKLPERDSKLDSLQSKDSFSEEEIGKVLEVLCKSKYSHALSENDQENLLELKTELVDKLKEYKVSGFSLCWDPNAAFIYDNQNPKFTVAFKNQNGDVKSQTYEGSITSWGLKYQLAIKLNLIFFVNTNVDFYESNKTIELGTGIDVSLPIPISDLRRRDGVGMPLEVAAYSLAELAFLESSRENQLKFDMLIGYKAATFPLDLMYVPFKEFSGGMIMVSFPLRLTAPFGLSIVTGGTLTPCK